MAFGSLSPLLNSEEQDRVSQLLLCKHLCINASVSEIGRCQLLGVGILFSACTVVCSVGEMMAHMKQSSS